MENNAMTVLDEFFEGYFSDKIEETRSDDQIINNNNLTKKQACEILAKRMGLPIHDGTNAMTYDLGDGYNVWILYLTGEGPIRFQKYSSGVFQYNIGPAKWNATEDDLKVTAEKYNYPLDKLLKASEIIYKVKEIDEKVANMPISKPIPKYRVGRRTAKSRQAAYDKQHGFGRQELLKSKAATLADIEDYIITIKAGAAENPDYWDNEASYNVPLKFIFKDKHSDKVFTFTANLYLKCNMDGWYSPGDSWGMGEEPPDGEDWLTGVRNIELNDIDVNEPYMESTPENEAIENKFMDIIEKYVNSGTCMDYIEERLADITGEEVR
jgi:hypothetical protein